MDFVYVLLLIVVLLLQQLVFLYQRYNHFVLRIEQ